LLACGKIIMFRKKRIKKMLSHGHSKITPKKKYFLAYFFLDANVRQIKIHVIFPI